MGLVHFLNVSDGDCSIVQHNTDRVSVIDVCCASKEPLVKKAVVAEHLPGNFNQKATPENPITYLAGLGVKSIHRFVLTHPDMDHMDGIEDFFSEFTPANFWDTNNTCEKEDFAEGRYKKSDWLFYKKLRAGTAQGPKRLALLSGASGSFYNRGENDTAGGDGIHVLAPTKELVDQGNSCEDYNEASYVLQYKSAGGNVVFGGDSHDAAWEHIAAHYKDLKENVKVLIAPHHGRKSERSFEFLDFLKPKLTLFGNAPSDYLAYGAWSSRKLAYVTNNQAGNIVVDTGTDPMGVYVSNKKFAETVYAKTVYSAAHHGYYIGAV